MRHRMRDIKKERIVFILPDKFDGLFRIPGCQHGLVLRRHSLDLYLSVFKILQREFTPVPGIFRMELPHVIGVKQAARLIESPVPGPSSISVADMPLTEDCGFITVCFEHFRHNRKLWVKTCSLRPMSSEHFRPSGKAPAQQRCPRG